MDYENINEDDTLADTMEVADTLALRKMLMKYRRLRRECVKVDIDWAKRVLSNNMLQVRKASILFKRGSGFFGTWQSRYFVLSTMGLVYFKQDEISKLSVEYEPQGYKPIADIVVSVAHDVSLMFILTLIGWTTVCF